MSWATSTDLVYIIVLSITLHVVLKGTYCISSEFQWIEQQKLSRKYILLEFSPLEKDY